MDTFWNRVNTSGPIAPKFGTECWTWEGGKFPNGYGDFVAKRLGIRHALAHRVSWEIANGPIPDGLLVCHGCDNPPCVRPDHLFLGTHADNAHDAIEKGRHSHGDAHSLAQRGKMQSGDGHWSRRDPGKVARGERAGQARLSAPEVVAIRIRFASGADNLMTLAEAFGVSFQGIWSIVHGKSWGSAGGPIVEVGEGEPRPARTRRGAGVHASKLDEAGVRAVRTEYAAGGVSLRALGLRYGVGPQAIHAIVQRQTWKHVE